MDIAILEKIERKRGKIFITIGEDIINFNDIDDIRAFITSPQEQVGQK